MVPVSFDLREVADATQQTRWRYAGLPDPSGDLVRGVFHRRAQDIGTARAMRGAFKEAEIIFQSGCYSGRGTQRRSIVPNAS